MIFITIDKRSGGEGGPASVVLVLGEAACEIIWRELSQHFWPGLEVLLSFVLKYIRIVSYVFALCCSTVI